MDLGMLITDFSSYHFTKFIIIMKTKLKWQMYKMYKCCITIGI